MSFADKRNYNSQSWPARPKRPRVAPSTALQTSSVPHTPPGQQAHKDAREAYPTFATQAVGSAEEGAARSGNGHGTNASRKRPRLSGPSPPSVGQGLSATSPGGRVAPLPASQSDAIPKNGSKTPQGYISTSTGQGKDTVRRAIADDNHRHTSTRQNLQTNTQVADGPVEIDTGHLLAVPACSSYNQKPPSSQPAGMQQRRGSFSSAARDNLIQRIRSATADIAASPASGTQVAAGPHPGQGVGSPSPRGAHLVRGSEQSGNGSRRARDGQARANLGPGKERTTSGAFYRTIMPTPDPSGAEDAAPPAEQAGAYTPHCHNCREALRASHYVCRNCEDVVLCPQCCKSHDPDHKFKQNGPPPIREPPRAGSAHQPGAPPYPTSLAERDRQGTSWSQRATNARDQGAGDTDVADCEGADDAGSAGSPVARETPELPSADTRRVQSLQKKKSATSLTVYDKQRGTDPLTDLREIVREEVRLQFHRLIEGIPQADIGRTQTGSLLDSDIDPAQSADKSDNEDDGYGGHDDIGPRLWTPQEERRLIQMKRDKFSASAICRELERSNYSVRSKWRNYLSKKRV